MKKKRLVSLAITATFILSSFSATSYAETSDLEFSKSPIAVPSSPIIGCLDLSSELKNCSEIQSKIMTFEEMVNHYANKNGISYNEALKYIPTDIKASATDRSIRYYTRSVSLNVTASYKPTLEFYCQIAAGTSTYNILSIYNVELDRNYRGVSKQFQGKIQAWLRSTQNIEYVVNGDFYNNGTTTVSGGIGVNAGLDELVTVSFGVSYSSNHYKYFYKHDWSRGA